MRQRSIAWTAACVAILAGSQTACSSDMEPPASMRQAVAARQRTRSPFNDGWRFTRGDPPDLATSLLHDDVKSWILPTGNDFVADPARRAPRPDGNLGDDVAYAQASHDDSSWQAVELPHDYAVAGPFTPEVSVSMGQLPSPGVVWYRKSFALPDSDAGKSIFLDIDGAMSYSMVWLNGQFVGGWPYGYASFRLDLTPHVNVGGENVVAIRLDNPIPRDSNWQSGSSRWYAGGGIYRNVWLVKTAPVHVAQWGSYITTPEISEASASVALALTVDNDSQDDASVSLATDIFEIDRNDRKVGCAVASIAPVSVAIPAGARVTADTRGSIAAMSR